MKPEVTLLDNRGLKPAELKLAESIVEENKEIIAARATPSEREQYTLSPYGIHWEHLDEDLCFEGFFKQVGREIA